MKSVCYHVSSKCAFINIFTFFFHFVSFTSHSSAVAHMILSDLMRVDTTYDSIALRRT